MADVVATMNIGELLRSTRLPESETPALDLELLLGHVLGRDRTYLYTWPDKVLNEQELVAFRQLVSKRAQGVPVAHLVGSRDFWTLTLAVSDKTLIPRPDTETLVQAVLDRVGMHSGSGAAVERLLDLGTGTGAIALALAKEMPQVEIVGVDYDEEIVQLADNNAARNQINNCTFLVSDWFSNLAGRTFTVIVSNPPYIESGDPHLRQGDLRYEPASALVSGEDGLADIRRIIVGSRTHLAPKGYLFLEHGYNQSLAVQALLEEAGFSDVGSIQDLGGHPRVTCGQWKGK